MSQQPLLVHGIKIYSQQEGIILILGSRETTAVLVANEGMCSVVP